MAKSKAAILKKPFKVSITEKGYRVFKKLEVCKLIEHGPLCPGDFLLPLKFIFRNTNIKFDSYGFAKKSKLDFLVVPNSSYSIFIDENGIVMDYVR